MIIGYLKNAIESEDIWIPSRIMIDELMNYVADENGRTNAIPGHNDDTVIALAISLEVLRTHGHRLTNNRVPFNQQLANYTDLQKGEWL